jgi:hypothetical protein
MCLFQWSMVLAQSFECGSLSVAQYGYSAQLQCSLMRRRSERGGEKHARFEKSREKQRSGKRNTEKKTEIMIYLIWDLSATWLRDAESTCFPLFPSQERVKTLNLVVKL